jgi:hypothetical protein
MFTETIYLEFNKDDFPRWARANADVMLVANSDLAYRCNVFSAATRSEKRRLTAEGYRRARLIREREQRERERGAAR